MSGAQKTLRKSLREALKGDEIGFSSALEIESGRVENKSLHPGMHTLEGFYC